MSSFNYKKWDNIELSDDESDLHPNIDKDSWFRMKHRSRLEREEREDQEIKSLNKLTEQDNSRINIINARLGNLRRGKSDDDAEFEDMEALEGERAELEANIAKRNAIINGYMNKRQWNIDNICKVKEERSIVNDNKATSLKAEDFELTGATERAMAENTAEKKKATVPASSTSTPSTSSTVAATTSPVATSSSVTSSSKSDVSVGPVPQKQDRRSALSYNDYVLQNEQVLETYSDKQSIEDTKAYLLKNADVLLHEHSQAYLLLSCLEDEMNKKHKRMKHVCRQSQILSHITELAVSMRRDPRDVINAFFFRLEEKEHFTAFTTAVSDFVTRIQARAIEKRKEMDEEERLQRIASNKAGLDPQEVILMLPEAMRTAFENQDVPGLQLAVSSLDPADARKYMKLCVDSGLWVPNKADEFEEGTAEEDGEDGDGEEEAN